MSKHLQFTTKLWVIFTLKSESRNGAEGYCTEKFLDLSSLDIYVAQQVMS